VVVELLDSKDFHTPEGCGWKINSDIQGVNRNLVIQIPRLIDESVNCSHNEKEELFKEGKIYTQYLDNLSEEALAQVAGGSILALSELVQNSQLEGEDKGDLIYRYGSHYRWFFWQAGQLEKGDQEKFFKTRYPVILRGAAESLVEAVKDKKDEALISDHANMFRATFRFLELISQEELVRQLRSKIETNEDMTKVGLKMFNDMFAGRFED